MSLTPYLKYATSRYIPYVLAACFTLTILGLHMLPIMDSMLNENNTRISHGFLKSQIDYHQEIAPFARRPITSSLINLAMDGWGLRAGHAFILINFTALFFSSLLLFRLSVILRGDRLRALGNMVFYFLSFSILFAFFPPIFSYDEPLQYCFILAALIAFVKRKHVQYILFFTMALVTRETSLLLLPAIIFLFTERRGKAAKEVNDIKVSPSGIQKKEGQSRSKQIPERSNLDYRVIRDARHYSPRLLLIALPVILYGVYLFFFLFSYDQFQNTRIEIASRYSCFLENFENTKNTIESITSLVLALAPFLYLTAVHYGEHMMHREQILKKATNGLTTVETHTNQNFQPWIAAFLLTAAINTPLVILTAFARETRLFALPLLFLWPVFLQVFGPQLKLFISRNLYVKTFSNWRYLLAFIGLNTLNYWFCFRVYREYGLGENTFFAEYLFIVNLLMGLHFLLFKSLQAKIQSQTSDRTASNAKFD